MIGAIAAGTGCGSAPKSAKAGYSTITTQELRARLDAGERPVIVVDLREPELYRAGHIGGAANIPFDQFDQRVSELNPEALIVLVCHTGPMGDVSGSLLAGRGYANVSNLKAGMAAWSGRLEK